MQGQNADAGDWSLDVEENEKAQEPRVFGIAVIPRHVEGGGTWILGEPPNLASP